MTYPFYIACAEHSTRTHYVNAAARAVAEVTAQSYGVAYSIVKGAYKGVAETSLALHGPRAARCALLIATLFNQESVLEVTGPASARLIDRNGQTLATFTRRIAGTPDNFTEIDGQRFTFAA